MASTILADLFQEYIDEIAPEAEPETDAIADRELLLEIATAAGAIFAARRGAAASPEDANKGLATPGPWSSPTEVVHPLG